MFKTIVIGYDDSAGAQDAVLEILDGMPATELLRDSERFDLLVLGSRGFGPVGRLLVGSAAARVVGSCACSLLVFPRLI